MFPAAFNAKVLELQLRMLVQALRTRPSKHATKSGEGRRFQARCEAREKLCCPDEFASEVNGFTRGQRRAWAKAGYPGLRNRDLAKLAPYSSERLRELLDPQSVARAAQ